MTAMAANTLFAQKDNPLLKEWNTPNQTPPFAEIKTEHYMPAVKQAMKEAEKNITVLLASFYLCVCLATYTGYAPFLVSASVISTFSC